MNQHSLSFPHPATAVCACGWTSPPFDRRRAVLPLLSVERAAAVDAIDAAINHLIGDAA